MILSGRQFREGRILPGLEQADLAREAGVAPALVAGIEAMDCTALMQKPDATALRSALEAAGVLLIADDGEGPGVRLREATKAPGAPE